jgi:hypothetical protein
MYVSNKYDLGDEVYFINDENTPCKSQVLSVNIYVDADGTEIEYEVKGDNDAVESYDEDELYSNEYDMKDKWMKDLIEFV